MFNNQEFEAAFSPLYCKQAYFTWENCLECAFGVLLHWTESALNNGRFIERYRSDPAMNINLQSTLMQSETLFSISNSFKQLIQHYIIL